MRERITYLFDHENLISPENLTLTPSSLASSSSFVAARQVKYTFDVEELPQKITEVLLSTDELHIRWATQQNYKSVSPWTSRISPGLHVFYTPKGSLQASCMICPALKKTFGEIDCLHSNKSFTIFSTNEFAHATSHQYYSPLPSLTEFGEYIQNAICSHLPPDLAKYCAQHSDAFVSSKFLEISYSSTSNSVSMSSFTPAQTQDISFSLPSSKDMSLKTRHEIGLLALQPSRVPGELSLGGFLILIGDDAAPKPTLFSVYSRHHSADVKFSARFLEPSGMHPNIELTISDSKPPVTDKACKLYAYFTLPRFIFVDKYQLADSLFLANKNLTVLRYMTDPVDLEKPEYAMTSWGSSVLIELAPPISKLSSPLQWTTQVPTHLRYLLPSLETNSRRTVDVPYPVVFWTCSADESQESSRNPFAQRHMGYDYLFEPTAEFFHLNPEAMQEDGRLVSSLHVPVLDLGQARNVGFWTVLAVGLGFLWVILCLLRVTIGRGYGPNKEKVTKMNKEK